MNSPFALRGLAAWALLAASLGCCGLAGASEGQKVVLCLPGSKQPLYTIAAAEGFFQREGLAPEFRNFTVGKLAFDGLAAGKCDLASSAEIPLVVRSFAENDIAIVATTRATNDQCWVVARADRGITSVKELSGRKVGVPKGTSPHFFLELLLQKHGLDPTEATEIFLPPEEIEGAFLSGSVDAVSLPALQCLRISKKMGDKAVVFREPGLCLNFSLLQVRRNVLQERPELVEKVLKALLAAQKFMAQNPAQARRLTRETNELSEEEYDQLMRETTEAVTLSNSLLLTMEESARWALEKGLATGERVPNYLNFIAEAPLKALAPTAVLISR